MAEFVRLTAGGDQPLTAVSAGIDPTLMALQLIILDGEERSSVNESLVHQGLALSTAFEPPDILELYRKICPTKKLNFTLSLVVVTFF